VKNNYSVSLFTIEVQHIIMQAPPHPPTDQAEAESPIPTEVESMSNGPNLRRKAAKRTLPWDLAAGELDLISPQPPQAEDIPAVARKKPRLEEPFSASTDEAARKSAFPDLSVDLAPPAADADGDIDEANTNADPSTDTQPNAVATGNWTLEEDAKLTHAVANISKKRCGKGYKNDWVVISTLVLGRTRGQCFHRWKDVLDPSIDRANGRSGKWTAVEDIKLKDAVHTHGDKDWVAISALVPGRTKIQCCRRWRDVLDPSIDRANGRTGKWAADEDSKLKDAVQTHGDKSWAEISALVPGRTRSQCHSRWCDVLDPSIDRANGRSGKWAEDEDSKLKDAVHTHGRKNWVTISALVPGRTRAQCNHRWHEVLNPSIGQASGRKGKWTAVEDSKLKDAVHTHGDKNWVTISALIPGRTKVRCYGRWRSILKHSVDEATGCSGKWTADEEMKLKDAVQMHGGNNWIAITALVPGRTKSQCKSRWYNTLDPSIDSANESSGKWAEDEDIKLKAAVLTHGDNNWKKVAVLVPGRRKAQCCHRWQDVLDPNIDRATGRQDKWRADKDELPEISGSPPPHPGAHPGAGQGIPRLPHGLSPGPLPGLPCPQRPPHPPQGYYQPLYPQPGQDPRPLPQYPPQRGYGGGGYPGQYNVPPPGYPYMPPYGMYPPYQHPIYGGAPPPFLVSNTLISNAIVDLVAAQLGGPPHGPPPPYGY
jgi:hypothetical protein